MLRETQGTASVLKQVIGGEFMRSSGENGAP